eukprot:6059002-Ditylum_brightwellii.AAC.1
MAYPQQGLYGHPGYQQPNMQGSLQRTSFQRAGGLQQGRPMPASWEMGNGMQQNGVYSPQRGYDMAATQNPLMMMHPHSGHPPSMM